MSYSEETQKEIKKLEAANNIMKAAQSNLNEMFNGIEKILANTKSTIIGLEAEKDNLEKIQKDQASEISGLSDQQQKLLKEYEAVKEELDKFTKVVWDGGEIKLEDLRALLAIYRTLLEEIWQSQPHFKILFLLHGDTSELNVESLKMASGITGAMILHACHELAKANLITFDVETKKAKLVKRLFPKKA